MDLHRRPRYEDASTDDDDGDTPDFGAQPPTTPNHLLNLDDFFDLDAFPMMDGHGEVIDLTTEDSPAEQQVEPQVNQNQSLTEDECRQRILEVFPDIELDHVTNMIRERGDAVERTPHWCGRLIEQILDEGTYPKERDKRNSLKRKRNDDDDDALIEQFEKNDYVNEDTGYYNLAKDILKYEFRDVPISHIEATLRKENTLFRTFNTLQTQLDNYNSVAVPAPRMSRPRIPITTAQNTSMSKLQNYDELQKELQAAKKNREKKKSRREKEHAEKLFEETNYRIAQQNKEMSECECCYSEFPTNRMTFCDGPVAHFFCLECAKTYVSTQMEMSKCRPECPSISDCKAPFSRSQLQRFLGKTTFDRLEHLQQLEDIQAAGLDNLEECPFCDYKAECPPVEIDREFRCINPTCGKTSCRLCHLETHIPKSCEENRKDNKINVRHTVEEAMTKALIRNCNQCKKPFVKDYGCNKMVCPSCGNRQCYVCSKTVRDYEHFSDDPNNRKCPLHDNTLERHNNEVKKAEEEALQKLRAEHPELTDEDLKVKVSEAVKKEEQARIRTAGVPPRYGAPHPPGGHDYMAHLAHVRQQHAQHAYRAQHIFAGPPGVQFGMAAPAPGPAPPPFLAPFGPGDPGRLPPLPVQMAPGGPPFGNPGGWPVANPFGGAPNVDRVPHFLQADGNLLDARQIEAARLHLERTRLEGRMQAEARIRARQQRRNRLLNELEDQGRTNGRPRRFPPDAVG